MNSKNKGIMMVLIAAVVVAIVTGVALFFFLSPQKTTIYTFNDNYKAGQVLTSDMLVAVQCDSSIVVAGKNTATSERFVTGEEIADVLNTGDSLRMDVAEDMPLTLAMLSVNGGSSVEMSMDPSKIAVTVPVDSISGVTNELKGGSRVNIYSTNLNTQKTSLIFQNMRVLAVSYTEDGLLESATIEVTAEESVKLVYASSQEYIYFGLVDGTGYQSIEGTPSYNDTSSAVAIPESELAG